MPGQGELEVYWLPDAFPVSEAKGGNGPVGYGIESYGVFTPLRLALTEVRFKANRPASDGEYKIELQDDALLMVLGERRRLAHYTNFKHRQLGPCSQTTFHATTIGHPQNRVPRRLSAQEMRHCHVHDRLALRGGGGVSGDAVPRRAGQ